MPAGGPETKRLEELRRDLRGMNLRDPDGAGACRAGALRDHLLENSRPAIPGDVVIGLHFRNLGGP